MDQSSLTAFLKGIGNVTMSGIKKVDGVVSKAPHGISFASNMVGLFIIVRAIKSLRNPKVR